jgi:hypothetical protein
MRLTKQNFLPLDSQFLRYINKLFSRKSIVKNFFTTNQIQSSKGIDIAADHLDKHSFLVIKNFFPKSLLTNVNTKIDKFIKTASLLDQEQIYEVIKDGKFGIIRRDVSYISRKKKKIYYDNNFYEMINYEKSKQRFLLEIKKKFDYLIKKFSLKLIIEEANKKNIRRELNKIYYYRDVNSPRPLHIDTYNNSIKFFVACNSINKIDDGPYSVIPGSHKKRNVLKLMEFYNKLRSSIWFDKFDGSFFSSSDAFIFFTEPGDLIITRQNAVHGDFPTINKTKRTMIVKHYLF